MKTILLALSVALGSTYSFAGEIALTFDDAPLPSSPMMSGKEKTTKIIKNLKAGGVTDALFFVTTQHINEDSSKRLLQYTDAGFHLANHSHMHKSANKTAVNEYLSDFYLSHLLTKKFDNLLKYHRFPYLHYGKDYQTRKEIQDGISELGYTVGYVTIDNFDWYINSKLLKAFEENTDINYENLSKLYVDLLWQSIEFYDAIAKRTLGRSPKHILLLHENELAALFLEDLIKHIQSKGWTIISPQNAYTDPIAIDNNFKHDFSKQGRVASIAHKRGVDIKELRHPSENMDYIDKKFIEYRVYKKSK